MVFSAAGVSVSAAERTGTAQGGQVNAVAAEPPAVADWRETAVCACARVRCECLCVWPPGGRYRRSLVLYT